MTTTIPLTESGAPPAEARHSPLETARRAIDALDDTLLALIEQRFALSLKVAALKQTDDGHLRIRPRREAEVLARLTARATTATPALIAHVWRELMAHSVQAQVPTTLVLHAPAAAVSGLGAGLRERFGRAAPLHLAASPREALDRVRDEQAIAAIALDDSGWWTHLPEEPTLTIFDRIGSGQEQVLLVGRIAREDVAEGCGAEVCDTPRGEVLATHDGWSLCRGAGQ